MILKHPHEYSPRFELAISVICLAVAATTLWSGCGGDSGEGATGGAARPTAAPINVAAVTYVSSQNGRSEIHQMSIFGSEFVNLSAKASSKNGYPSWSPACAS